MQGVSRPIPKPADRLHAIRQRIAALKAEEESLRQGLINGTLPLDGDEYSVEIEEKVNQRIDFKSMREHVAESIWRPYLIEKPSIYVKTMRKTAGDDLRSSDQATV